MGCIRHKLLGGCKANDHTKQQKQQRTSSLLGGRYVTPYGIHCAFIISPKLMCCFPQVSGTRSSRVHHLSYVYVLRSCRPVWHSLRVHHFSQADVLFSLGFRHAFIARSSAFITFLTFKMRVHHAFITCPTFMCCVHATPYGIYIIITIGGGVPGRSAHRP